MLSLRDSLINIGIPRDEFFSYRNDFYSRPVSLRQAIRSMSVPQNWSPVSDFFRDDYWTDEVQGIAWDGENWIFSCNANQIKPGVRDKGLYVFKGGQSLDKFIHDNTWICSIRLIDIPHNFVDKSTWYQWWVSTYPGSLLPPEPYYKESWDHWGQVTYFDGYLYVSHFWQEGPLKKKKNIVVFKSEGGILTFDRWIEIGKVSPSDGTKDFYPELQAINPWDGYFYTGHGVENTKEFYLHYPKDHPKAGQWTGNVFKFSGGEQKLCKLLNLLENPPYKLLNLPSNVQGACFSPNGHLYVACNCKLSGDSEHMAIGCFSALNGHLMGIIPVLALEGKQELEGICYADVVDSNGRKTQIHVVLLENEIATLDDIYLKGYAASEPQLV